MPRISKKGVIRDRFEEKGFVRVENVFQESELDQLIAEIDDILEKFGKSDKSREETLKRLARESGVKEKGRYAEMTKLHEITGLLRHLVPLHALETKIQNVCDVIYPEYDLCFTALTDILIGFPEDDRFHAWHQEFSSMGEVEILNFWYPVLQDATPKNGAMKILEGSHRNGLHPWERESHHPEYGHPVDNRIPKNIDDLIDEHPLVRGDVKRGDVIVFHSNLVHKSGPIANNSPRMTGIMKMGPVRDDLPSELSEILETRPQRD